MIIWQKAKELFKNIFDSTGVRAIGVGTLAISVIVISFVIAIFVTKNPDDAGRGGAFVVAISFYYILKDVRITDSRLSREGQTYLERQIDRESRILLSVMSITGTLAWGFLDIVAECILWKM